MHILRQLFIAIVTLAAFAGAASTASAAESYDSCLGFIDALPAAITTPGHLVSAAEPGHFCHQR